MNGPKGKHVYMNLKTMDVQHLAGIMPLHCNIKVLPMHLSLRNEMPAGDIFLLYGQSTFALRVNHL